MKDDQTHCSADRIGAELGLGAALCRRFASEGLHVLVAGRTPSKLEQLAKAVSAAGERDTELLPIDDRSLLHADSSETNPVSHPQKIILSRQ